MGTEKAKWCSEQDDRGPPHHAVRCLDCRVVLRDGACGKLLDYAYAMNAPAVSDMATTQRFGPEKWKDFVNIAQIKRLVACEILCS